MVRFEFKLQNHGFCFGIFLRLSEALQIFNMSWKLIISQPESYQILEIHFFFFAITEVSNKKVIT